VRLQAAASYLSHRSAASVDTRQLAICKTSDGRSASFPGRGLEGAGRLSRI
jgi:hypothetical protein